MVFNIFKKKVKQNYFDLPAKDQKKILLRAVRDANKKQIDMVNKYNLLYNKSVKSI